VNDSKRLIEVDFPLEQVSLDSVHEKNVRHGHISTLHIWPARRPLAASPQGLGALVGSRGGMLLHFVLLCCRSSPPPSPPPSMPIDGGGLRNGERE
jgi:hypothetical protein